MKGRYPRALVVAAVTNPLVWLVALLALVVAMCAVVVTMYAVVWLLVRDELCSPNTTSEPAITLAAEDDGPVVEPTPGFDARLDEHGRVELVTLEPEVVPAAPPPAAPEPVNDRKPRRRKTGDASGVPEPCADRTHADLVRLAHRAGFKNANKRWSRGKLVAVLAAPCSHTETR